MYLSHYILCEIIIIRFNPYRRFFHWFAYVLLFQNAFVGLFSTFIRIIISLAFGLILFMRLDKVVLMKGFEFFDFGKTTIKK